MAPIERRERRGISVKVMAYEARRHGARQQVHRPTDPDVASAEFNPGVIVQPLVALLGIVMGSSVALLAGLTMVLAVFMLMPEFHDRLAGEYVPLLRAIAWAVLLAVTSAAAFVGQLKSRPWRFVAQLGLVVSVGFVAWNYWPA
jgi:hypothetical protein